MPNTPKTVLVLAPHPDDAEYYAGGTLAKMASEGARIIIAIATDGGKGSFEYDASTLVRMRAEEARQAAKILGAEQVILLGHPDQELICLPAGELREQFVRLIRQYRPDVLIAEDPLAAGETHPDHRAVAWAASDALYAWLPLLHPDHRAEGLEPHFVTEKYFYSEDFQKCNKIVDITETFQTKLAALAEHQSQMRFMVEDILRQAQVAGLDANSVLCGITADPTAAIGWFMEAGAAEVGARAGVRYGEAFRYERFHPLIEGLLDKG